MTKRTIIVLAACIAANLSPTAERSAFREVAGETGLRFQHVNGGTGRYHLPEIMGAGGAFFDYDSDGDLDVLLIQGGSLTRPAGRGRPGPRLFRNELIHRGRQTAGLRFTDVSAAAGFVAGDYGMGVSIGDFDNDGDPDVYLTNFGPNRLYRNDGNGTFGDVTRSAGEGLDDPRWSTSASFSDYDADGDLDLFVVNYVDFTVADSKVCHDPTGIRDYCGPLQFRPVPDRLFRNDGNSTFTDVSEQAGLTRAVGNGLGVVGVDLNGDRRLDFYVANDAMPNHLWLSRGDGRFAEGAALAGLAYAMDGRPEGSMGIAAGDADNDGDVDLFVTNITRESHAFYLNLGRGLFEDRRIAAGLRAATLPYTGFGTDWFDYDHDGWLDLFVANGAVTLIEALAGRAFPFRQPNLLLHNARGVFRDASAEGGPAVGLAEVSRGAAFGDVDNDGDIDVLVTTNNGPVRLLLNEGPASSAGLVVGLEGVADNRQGLGARVGLRLDDGSTRWRHVHTDGSYLSSSDGRAHFGLGRGRRVEAVLVEWPRGAAEIWRDPPPGPAIRLRQGTGGNPSVR